MATATGRWSEAEHSAFEEGLRRFGTNWRAIARLVPTRTLVQIRTHAQKYFLKHGMPGREGEEAHSDDAGMTVTPVATLRHVALEPVGVPASEGLGLDLAMTAVSAPMDAMHVSFASIQGFLPVPASGTSGPVLVSVPGGNVPGAGAAPDGRGHAATQDAEAPLISHSQTALQVAVAEKMMVPGAAEESDLVRIGDSLIGVSGVCTANMDVSLVHRVISIARGTAPGGIVVLHLCDAPIDATLIEEASIQMSNAAAQLLGSRQVVESVQAAVYTSLLNSVSAGMALPPGGAAASVPSMPTSEVAMTAQSAY